MRELAHTYFVSGMGRAAPHVRICLGRRE